MPDAMDVALGDTIVLQLLDQALDDIIQARAETAARHNGRLAVLGIKVHLLPGSGPHGPGRQWHTHLQHAQTGFEGFLASKDMQCKRVCTLN